MKLARTWRADTRGAAAVQFIAVLPVFLILVLGIWSLFQLYSAHQTLCEAVSKAQRYLQVEGPYFPDDVIYPDGWVPYAVDIINSELKSNAMTPMQIGPQDVYFYPTGDRRSPQKQSEVEYSVPAAWFHIRVTSEISGTLGVLAAFFENVPAHTARVTCQTTGFYEGAPLRSTDNANPGATRLRCPLNPPRCTPGPPPTSCSGPGCPTPDPCPCEPW